MIYSTIVVRALEGALEEGTYRLLKYFIMALVIAGVITIPIVFYVRGDYWGRVVTAFWSLIVVALSAWIANKVIWGLWRKRVKEGAV